MQTDRMELFGEIALLDVFLAAYQSEAGDKTIASVIDPADDLLTLDVLRRILAALRQPTTDRYDAGGLADAAAALLADVRRRHPGEELRCEYMIALDAALTKGKTMPNKSEIALLAKAILEVNKKAAVVWSYDSGDRVGAEMCLEPETEKALHALARETPDAE